VETGREHIEAVELVNEFAQAIACQGDTARIIAEAIARTRDLCEADGASLLTVDPETGELRFQTASGERAHRMVDLRLAPGQGIAGRVAQTAQALCVSDVTAEPTFDPRCDTESGFQTGSLIAVPLLVGGDLVGVLEAVRAKERAPLAEAELRRLEMLAPHIAIAVRNGQVTDELRRTQLQVLEANRVLEQRVEERTSQISRAKREWERTFDAISEPIAMQDGFVLRRTNLAYARHVGLSVRELPGRTCHQVMAGRDTPCPGCPLLEASGLGSASAELRSGQQRTLHVTGFRVDGVDDQNVVLHYRDVTHERGLEERLRESERLAAVGQLASGAAHEINNPLGFLSSNLESLRTALSDVRDATRDQAAEMADLVSDCQEMVVESLDGARRVGEIVRGLRELSRLEISSGTLTRLSDSVTRAVRSELAADPRATLEVPEELFVHVDPLKLDQVISQLLRNARQAIESSGHIRVKGWAEGAEVCVRIDDDGCGIAPENVRRVFEPFFTTRGVGKGVGLGLTAAWGIVTRFGGRIDVRSEPGRGTSFTVRLPAAERSAAPKRSVGAPHVLAGS
jgi:C4-dicarboxylate-specific signal transduction histidine kinase